MADSQPIENIQYMLLHLEMRQWNISPKHTKTTKKAWALRRAYFYYAQKINRLKTY